MQKLSLASGKSVRKEIQRFVFQMTQPPLLHPLLDIYRMRTKMHKKSEKRKVQIFMEVHKVQDQRLRKIELDFLQKEEKNNKDDGFNWVLPLGCSVESTSSDCCDDISLV